MTYDYELVLRGGSKLRRARRIPYAKAVGLETMSVGRRVGVDLLGELGILGADVPSATAKQEIPARVVDARTAPIMLL